jgi:hypothetical protein
MKFKLQNWTRIESFVWLFRPSSIVISIIMSSCTSSRSEKLGQKILADVVSHNIPAKHPSNKLLTMAEAAKMFSISLNPLSNATSRNQFPYLKSIKCGMHPILSPNGIGKVIEKPKNSSEEVLCSQNHPKYHCGCCCSSNVKTRPSRIRAWN